MLANRPYVTGIKPAYGPPYGPLAGPAPVAADSAILDFVKLRASLDATEIGQEDIVRLHVTVTNPADTALVLTYGSAPGLYVDWYRALPDGETAPIVLEGTRSLGQAVVWADTIPAHGTRSAEFSVHPAVLSVPVPAGTYDLRVFWSSGQPELPDLNVSFRVKSPASAQ